MVRIEKSVSYGGEQMGFIIVLANVLLMGIFVINGDI